MRVYGENARKVDRLSREVQKPKRVPARTADHGWGFGPASDPEPTACERLGKLAIDKHRPTPGVPASALRKGTPANSRLVLVFACAPGAPENLSGDAER